MNVAAGSEEKKSLHTGTLCLKCEQKYIMLQYEFQHIKIWSSITRVKNETEITKERLEFFKRHYEWEAKKLKPKLQSDKKDQRTIVTDLKRFTSWGLDGTSRFWKKKD